ncbi:hypothetical protein J2W40_002313 [Sphingobium xenophagum]|uniref:Sulfotransferase domain-containing protein n=1 Tax=Sphingobium xenophagum TaxID=121428 RepID=A0ABU1X1N6_SPHXE|nr:hypothetical protein [Sphingobium xenophagum]MDR7155486.1 hypothetical protein [Sphingobium xenophagum]
MIVDKTDRTTNIGGDAVQPKLVLHAGPGKTGTSAIQKWLTDNKDLLKNDGYDYPEPSVPGTFAGNASELIQILLAPPDVSDVDMAPELDKILASYRNDLAQSRCSTLILSNELFSSVNRNRLHLLKERIAPLFALDVILVVREPYGWLWSAWGQCVKRLGEADPFIPFLERAVGFYEQAYATVLDIFDPVTLIPYSRDALLFDMAKAMGLDPVLYQTEAASVQTINRSMTADELEILRRINRINGNPSISQRISDYLIEQSPDAVTEMVIDPGAIALIQKCCGPVLTRLRKSIPNLDMPRAGTISDENERPIVIGLDAMEYIATVIQSDDSVRHHLVRLHQMLSSEIPQSNYDDLIPPDFDPVIYLLLNQDVLNAGVDPTEHFISYGKAHGRPYKRPRRAKAPSHLSDNGPDIMPEVTEKPPAFGRERVISLPERWNEVMQHFARR